MNKQRLLDVASACRAANPKDFTMQKYVNQCGTPACALGNYSMLPGNPFSIRRVKDDARFGARFEFAFSGVPIRGYDDQEIQEWFGIDEDECRELFSDTGCGGRDADEDDEDDHPVCIEDPIAAAEYIEDFVRRHEQEAP